MDAEKMNHRLDDISRQLEQHIRDNKNHLDRQDLTLYKLNETINGNGKPGLKTEMAMFSRDAKRVERWVWVVIGAIVMIAADRVFVSRVDKPADKPAAVSK